MMLRNFIKGVVIDTSDPQQMGRVRAWCPALDGESYNPADLPWATYISPFAGQAYDYPAGDGSVAGGPMAYGFWAIPKVGATIVIGFLYGDRNQRFYMGALWPEHGNRSIPAGRNTADGPQSDSYEPVQPATANLGAQFQGNLTASEAQTRGVYERQAAQAVTDKDGTEGYQKGVLEAGLDPQTYALVTPGRHAIIMQDNPATGRLRLKTANGHQIILDDANERIYVSTAKGASWIELDQDGRIHVYAGDSVSISSGGDLNLVAKGKVNVQAGGDLNLSAGGHARLSACTDASISGDTVNLESDGAFNLKAAGTILQTGSNIHLNGPGAASAPCADLATVVPNHEPWVRDGSKSARGSNWKA